MTDEIVDFFVEHDFSIIVSLDGDREDHDRNRVTANREGTFDRVMGYINRLRTRHPHYDRLGLSVCYDYKTDLFKMCRFIQKEDLFIVKMSRISGSYTDYYDQFTPEDEGASGGRWTHCVGSSCNAARIGTLTDDKFLFALFGTEYAELSFHSMSRENRLGFLPYTAVCVPGDKICVSTYGGLLYIQRMSYSEAYGVFESYPTRWCCLHSSEPASILST